MFCCCSSRKTSLTGAIAGAVITLAAGLATADLILKKDAPVEAALMSEAVFGTWDGSAFASTEAIPGALYDPAAPTPAPTPAAATAYPDDELQRISDGLRDRLPGYLGSYGAQGSDGHVFADVVYDDGSLQAWADATYGAGVVVVTPALVDVG